MWNVGCQLRAVELTGRLAISLFLFLFFFRFLFIGYLLDGDGDTKWRGEMKNVGNFMREISLPRL